jgi:Kef-type K+ transport system membrane component KefB
MRLDVASVFTAQELVRVAIFFVLLLLARGLPALLYKKHVGLRGSIAAGLMQATNVSFIVVATSVGLELKEMRPITASSLVVAGLLSAIIFPVVAQAILARGTEAA